MHALVLAPGGVFTSAVRELRDSGRQTASHHRQPLVLVSL